MSTFSVGPISLFQYQPGTTLLSSVLPTDRVAIDNGHPLQTVVEVQTLLAGGEIQTGLVQKAIFAIFPTIPPASWADFVTQYVGDRISTDGSFQAVFVVSIAPVDGAFWQLLDTYLQAIGFSPADSETFLVAIWSMAATLPA